MKIKKLVSFSFGPILGALFGFITLPLLAWYLPPEDVGRFSMLQVVLNLGVMVISLALHQSYVREYNEISDKGQLLAISFWPSIIFLFLIIFLIEVFQISISKLIFGVQDYYLDYAVYAGVFLSLVINSLSHVLRMQERGIAFSLSQIVPRLSLLMFIGAIVTVSTEVGFKEIIFCNILALLCTTLLFIFLIRSDIKQSISSLNNIDLKLLSTMFSFALPLMIGSLAYWLLTTVDRIFIQNYTGYDRLGIYVVAVSIASSVVVVTSVFSTLWHPIVYRWAKEGIDIQNVQTVVDYVFIVVLLIWSLVGMTSGLIGYILPLEYVDVEYLLVVCFSVPLLYLLSETTMVGISISRKSNYAMLASIAALLSSIVFNYLLVPILAEKGAAISSMLSFVIFFVVRTEATCALWKPLDRKKIYVMLLLYVACAAVHSLQAHTSGGIVFLWPILWITTALLYRERINFVINFLIKEKFSN